MTVEDRDFYPLNSVGLAVAAGSVLLSLAMTYWPISFLSPLRIFLGLGAVLFAPGYVTVAAIIHNEKGLLKKELSETKPSTSDQWTESQIGVLEQLVLSILTSIIVVVLLGLLLDFISLGITPRTILWSLSGYTLFFISVGALRQDVPMEQRFQWLNHFLMSGIDRLKNPPTRVDAFLNVLLLVILVSGGIAATPMVQNNSEGFTEFSVLNRNESGDPVMQEYLSSLEPNETAHLLANITNKEDADRNYTMIVQVQRARVTNHSVEVTERRQVSQQQIKLEQGQTAEIPYDLTVSNPKTGCRVAFLLYDKDVPRTPTVENAYRELHLWHTENPSEAASKCNSLSAINVQKNTSTARS